MATLHSIRNSEFRRCPKFLLLFGKYFLVLGSIIPSISTIQVYDSLRFALTSVREYFKISFFCFDVMEDHLGVGWLWMLVVYGLMLEKTNGQKIIFRGEKLYVTKDKRIKSKWRKYLCWAICLSLVAGAVLIGILAACMWF